MQTQTNKPKQKSTIWILLSASATTLLLCLPSLLAGVAIRPYNDRISFLPQEPSEAFLPTAGKVHLCQDLEMRLLCIYSIYHDMCCCPNPTFSHFLCEWAALRQIALKVSAYAKTTWVSLSLSVLDLCCLL